MFRQQLIERMADYGARRYVHVVDQACGSNLAKGLVVDRGDVKLSQPERYGFGLLLGVACRWSAAGTRRTLRLRTRRHSPGVDLDVADSGARWFAHGLYAARWPAQWASCGDDVAAMALGAAAAGAFGLVR